MTHPIIKTEGYILITSDEEIKEGDMYISDEKIFYMGIEMTPYQFVGKKVIAHLPLNNEPILEGVPLLPPLPNEEDVDKLAEKEFPHISTDERIRYLTIVLRDGFVTGHKKAKEKYKFTEEDVIKIVEKSRETGLTAEYLMLSLSQPKLPIGFKREIEVECTGNDNNGCFMDAPGHDCGCVKTKIINGVMQGEWIFE